MSYTEIFRLIRLSLIRQSLLSEDEFEKALEWFKSRNFESMNDDEIWETLVEVVFYSGMRASTVTKMMPKIMDYFGDYRKAKDYSDEDLKLICSDKTMIKHRKKVRACRNNAKEFFNIVSTYKSFKNYIKSIIGKDKNIEELNTNEIKKLKEKLKNQFEFLGNVTVYHFLTDLGFNVLKPDRVICRIFHRLGFIRERSQVDEAVKIGRKIAEETNQPIRYIDIIFVKYGQKGGDEKLGLKDGICLEEKPKCELCLVKQYCQFFQKKHKGTLLNFIDSLNQKSP